MDNQVKKEEEMVNSLEEIKEENQEKIPKDKTKNKKVLTIILSIVLLIISFFGGYLTNNLIRGKNANFASDIVSLMDKVAYIYDEKTGDYKKLTEKEIGDALVKGICDDYSKYYTEEEYKLLKENSKGNYSGFGVSFFDEEDLIVDQITMNSPFHKANIMVGDEITSCVKDGVETAFSNTKELFNYLQNILENQQITVNFNRQGLPLSAIVKKQVYKTSYVYYCDNEYEYQFISEGNNEPSGVASKKTTSINDDSVGYIYLSKFEGNAAIQLGEVLNFMKTERNKTKLILDLKDNGGGYMNVLTHIASYFINNGGKEKSVVAISKGKSENQTFTTQNNRFCSFITDLRILANENTASASECLIGVIATYKDYNFKMADIIVEKNKDGEGRTYGKGIMQTTYELLSGGALKLTTAKVLWPDNATCIHKKGVNSSMGAIQSEKGGALLLALNSFK